MYENLIKEVLSFLYIKKPPIKPDVIAYGLGLELYFINLPSNISGILYNKNNRPMIIINKSDYITRQRFTLAHEIGHYLLHNLKNNIHFDCSYSKNSNIEKEANNFAASLLLPNFILEKYSKFSIEDLSKIFLVSKQVVEIRLKNLNNF